MDATTAPARNPAEAYEQYLVPAMFDPWVPELIERAQPRPGDRVLDLACGTGIVARRTAPLVAPRGYVDALDINPGMLAVARDVAEREDVSVTFHQGDMQALPFRDDSYDLVTCQQGLQFVPDRPAAVSEMRRVLATGGRAVIVCWGPIEDDPLMVAMAPIFEQHTGVPALKGPHALGNPDELRALFTAAGFTILGIDSVRKTARFSQPDRFIAMAVGGAVAAIPAMQQMSPEEREQLVAVMRVDLDPALRDFLDGDEVVSPKQAHIVLAQG